MTFNGQACDRLITVARRLCRRTILDGCGAGLIFAIARPMGR
jgi:hypothetical protein